MGQVRISESELNQLIHEGIMDKIFNGYEPREYNPNADFKEILYNNGWRVIEPSDKKFDYYLSYAGNPSLPQGCYFLWRMRGFAGNTEASLELEKAIADANEELNNKGQQIQIINRGKVNNDTAEWAIIKLNTNTQMNENRYNEIIRESIYKVLSKSQVNEGYDYDDDDDSDVLSAFLKNKKNQLPKDKNAKKAARAAQKDAGKEKPEEEKEESVDECGKKVKRISEAQFREMVAESVKRCIEESLGGFIRTTRNLVRNQKEAGANDGAYRDRRYVADAHASGQLGNRNQDGSIDYFHDFGPAEKTPEDVYGEDYGETESIFQPNGDMKYYKFNPNERQVPKDWNGMSKVGRQIATNLGNRAYNRAYDKAARQGEKQYGRKAPVRGSYT